MACIDAEGNLTRSGELMLLAVVDPADMDAIIEHTGLAPFRVRSGVRELAKAGFIQVENGLYRLTDKGEKQLEGADDS